MLDYIHLRFIHLARCYQSIRVTDRNQASDNDSPKPRLNDGSFYLQLLQLVLCRMAAITEMFSKNRIIIFVCGAFALDMSILITFIFFSF